MISNLSNNLCRRRMGSLRHLWMAYKCLEKKSKMFNNPKYSFCLQTTSALLVCETKNTPHSVFHQWSVNYLLRMIVEGSPYPLTVSPHSHAYNRHYSPIPSNLPLAPAVCEPLEAGSGDGGGGKGRARTSSKGKKGFLSTPSLGGGLMLACSLLAFEPSSTVVHRKLQDEFDNFVTQYKRNIKEHIEWQMLTSPYIEPLQGGIIPTYNHNLILARKTFNAICIG